jgi:acyl-CoA synthetase (AMP-forming)/AMP-acid ligase II
MSAAQASGLVHAPLEEWARSRGNAIAIASGTHTLSFAALHAAVTQRAQQLTHTHAPATIMVDPAQDLPQRLVDFLGIVASGRCAEVADPDWTAAVMHNVRSAITQQGCDLSSAQPDSAFYVGFTSGSTGVPKGFRRNHRSWVESFRVCLQDFGPDAGTRILAPGRDSHSLFLFGMLLGLWTGAGVVVQEKFSAAAALDILRQGDTPSMITAPSQLILMLDVARHRKLAPIEAVRLIMISGARWMRSRTAELRALFPQTRIIEFYGASETSFIAWMDSDDNAAPAVVGRPFSNVQLQIREADDDGVGMIYVHSPMVFMDYFGTADDTAALRDGEWLSVRDLGRLDAQGFLSLAGRQNRMIVTQGKNLFSEELEAVLESHAAIAAASVHGVDDARRGALVVAIIRWAPDAPSVLTTALDISAWCKRTLEAYKAPRKVFVCTDWPLTAGGKTDHRKLGQSLQAHLLSNASTTPAQGLPCLHTLP